MSKIRYLLFGLAAAALLMSAISPPSANGQAAPTSQPTQSSQPAPHVINSVPAAHAESAPDQPVQIAFDQAMDHASVEAALKISPTATFKTNWRDEKTLTITFDQALTRGQTYTLTIDAAAKATNGAALGDTFSLPFDVTAALHVTQVIPAPNTTQVQAGSTITVIFSRPVVPLVTTGDQSKLVQPLTLSPTVAGHGEWVNTAIYIFHPDKPLPGGTQFTVTVAPDLKDVTGSPLDKPYNWQFSTIAPQVLSVSPEANAQQVNLDAYIDITFNQPMDHTSTEGAFAVLDASGKRVPGAITWDQNDTVLLFKPATNLALGAIYRVSLTGTAHSAAGTATVTNPFNQRFTAVPYPAFVRSEPTNGQQNVYPGSGISLEYNAPMDERSFAGKVHISPAADNLSVSGGGSQIYVNFASLPQTTYTVTVDAGVTDPYGNTIKTPTVVTFTTGALQPSLGVATRGQVNLTNAYLPDTILQTATTNVQQIDWVLGTVAIPDLMTVMNNGQDLTTAAKVIRNGQQAIEAAANKPALSKIKLAGNQGGTLPPGLYVVSLTSPQLTIAYQNYKQVELLAVGTANLTLKTSPTEALVWATDLKTGLPIPNAPITLYGMRQYNTPPVVLATGKTDANGLFSSPIKLSSDSNPYSSAIWAVAQGDGLFGITSNNGAVVMPYDYTRSPFAGPLIPQNPQPASMAAYIYTDQPIYRPGHPVYFRGILRNQNDVTYSVPAGGTVKVVLNDAQGKPVYQKDLPISDMGVFNGEYDLPQDTPIGYYNMAVTYKTQNFGYGFQVADYRPPEYMVSATPKVNQVVAGDTISVDVDSTFFFGGAVSNTKLTWNAVANQAYFNYTGDGQWDFSPINNQYVYQRTVGSGTSTTDANGHFTITLPADLGGINVTQSFSIEATITDLNNQPVSGRTTVTVHPAKVYAGIQLTSPLAEAGKPTSLKLIAVDWASQPIPNQKLRIDVATLNWQQDPTTLQWSEVKTPVIGDDLVTDSKGLASYSFTPSKSGLYVVTVLARDSGEKVSESDSYIYVSGPQPFNYGRSDDKSLKLVADKALYQPGDTASILIPSPFTGTVKALVTVERAHIMKTEVIDVTGGQTYKLPLSDLDAPDVYVSVTLIAPMADKTPNPDYRTGIAQLHTHVKERLIVKLTPSVSSAKPGDTVHFDVLTTDENGKPIAASVGLKLTDLANLSVSDQQAQSIFDAFWSDRGLSVTTGLSLTELIDDIVPQPQQVSGRFAAADGIVAPSLSAPGAPPAEAQSGASNAPVNKVGGGGAAAIQVRSNFVDTPFWNADVRTDGSGHGGADVKLPDNLTTWQLDGRGISADTYAGQNTTQVISTKPLLVRPATPRFFVVGDQPELATVVNNNTGSDLSVVVSLDAKGVTITGNASQTVTIPKDGRARIAWQATVQDVDNVDLTFIAVSGDYNDASKPTVGLGDAKLLPVYKYSAPDYVATAGTLTSAGSRTEGISLPVATAAPTAGSLTVRLSPSLAAATLDGLKALKNYPYQGIERTISKFLPNIVTYHALQSLNLADPTLKANLDKALAEALARLKSEQHADGGWGWYPQDESNPTVTAYALLGLTEAKAADLPIDAAMYEQALRYMLGQIQSVSRDTSLYGLDTQAFMGYVLARAGSPNVNALDTLFVQREKMNYFARAFLAQSYHLVNGDQNKISALLSDLQNAAILSATGAHWEEPQRDWYNWDSNTRTTAIVLKTLIDLTPKDQQSQLIPNVVRWLMVARRGDVWESSQETAWALMGLTDWMVASGELKANYAYNVTLNGSAIGNGQANASTLRDTTTLSVDIGKLLADQLNLLTVQHTDGPGSLYYTATLTVQQPVEGIVPVDRGMSFTRTYLINGKPVTTAHVGDTITVTLDITVPHDLYFAVINDPFPAGTEAVDTSLKTTSQIGKTPELSLIDPYEGWGWWSFSSTALETNQAVLTARYLPSGSYRYVYQVQATQPGTYRVIPPNGQELYFPEVFGRGAGSLFTIAP
jgi:hypothetical protein